MISFLCKPTCILCDDLTHRGLDLCYSCEKELPTLQNYCIRCAEPLSTGLKVCGSCLREPPYSLKIIVPFIYQAPINLFITNLKFRNNLLDAKILGKLLSQHLEKQYQNIVKPELIIPVPPHASRLRERGYNQSLEISREIAAKLKIPIARHSVRRMKNTLPQAILSAKKRQHNIKGAFNVVKNFYCRHVAIVDDVITTGNTVTELCKTLFRSGTIKIDVWCCAKS